MGAWGESIFADDDALDVYHHYRRLFNQGKEHQEVRLALERCWADSIDDSDDGPIFWFAIARAQWEFGSLDDDVLAQITEITEKGLGLDRWREGGPKMLAQREQAVRDFLEKISKPNPKPTKRKAEKRHPPIYLPGACLAIELSDGSFGAAIVLATDDRHETEGFDAVALLEWRSEEKPPPELFHERPKIRPNENGRLIPVVRRCYARSHRKVKKALTQIGQAPQRKDDAEHRSARFMGQWEAVISDLEHYYGLRS